MKIPDRWKPKLKTHTHMFTKIMNRSFKEGTKYHTIEKISCKEYYWILVGRNYIRPVTYGKWESTTIIDILIGNQYRFILTSIWPTSGTHSRVGGQALTEQISIFQLLIFFCFF